VGPLAQGQGLPGQPLGLVEVAAQHRLAGPEQRGMPGEVELSQLAGGPVVALQATLQGRQVALLELIGQQEPAAAERRHRVAGGLGQLDHLGGRGQPLLQVVRPPGRHVVLVEPGGQGGGVAEAPGHGHGGPAEPVPPPGVGRGLQRLGQPGQHPGPERAVGLAQDGQGLLQQLDLQLVDRAGGELPPQAEGGQGEPGAVAHPPGRLRRAPVQPARLVGLAGGHPGPGQGQQQVAPLGLVGPGLEVQGPQGPLVVAGGLLVGEHLHGPVAGLPGVGDRLVGLAGAGRLGEVVGQLGQVALEVVAAQLDQGRAHPVVQAPPLPGGELIVQGLVDKGVGEPEAARAALHLHHQLGVHRLLEVVEHVAGRRPGGPGDYVQVEVAALHRGRGQAGVGGVGEPVEPPADHVPDALGNARLPQPAGLQAPLGGQQADQLADEVGLPSVWPWTAATRSRAGSFPVTPAMNRPTSPWSRPDRDRYEVAGCRYSSARVSLRGCRRSTSTSR
jgi:hypothetical protein